MKNIRLQYIFKIQLLFISMWLCSFMMYGQYTGVTTYDFRDGTIISAGQSDDGNLLLGGTYSLHNGTAPNTYGVYMNTTGTLSLTVTGSNTVRFLGSAYSSVNMIGSVTETGDLGTQDTKVATDLTDTYDFCYGGVSGTSETIEFTLEQNSGSALYLPYIDVIPAQAGADASLTSADENIIYYYDFRDGSIIPTTTTGTEDVSLGLIDVLVGSQNAYGYNGTQHGCAFKPGNQIVLDVAGNSYIKVGGSIYSGGEISVSSSTGDFDVTSQSATTSANFDTGSTSVDFLYVGDAGTVTIDFSATTYVPYIEVVPVPYEVSLASYVQKSGTITINGVDVSYTAGADASTYPTVAVSNGTVVSATTESASIYIDLGGNTLSSFTPVLSGDIASVDLSNDESIEITLSDDATDPKTYSIKVVDNSIVVNPEPGALYSYNFYDGSELPQISYSVLRYATYFSKDGLLTINSNTTNTSYQFGYHYAAHGASMFPGNSMDIKVAGDAIISIIACRYGSAVDAVWVFTDADDNVLGSIQAKNNENIDAYSYDFSYAGDAGVITATLQSDAYPTNEIYVHGLSVSNSAAAGTLNGKIAVWDFGAEQLDETTYVNRLNVDAINAWYESCITVGSSNNTLPNFSAEELSFVGGGNDRLRTTNTSLTRYDENVATYAGRIYVNASAATGRYISMSLSEDDEVTIVAECDNGSGILHFANVTDPEIQSDEVSLTSDPAEYTFVAKAEGTYRFYDSQDKPSYYRVYRKNATYSTVTGSVDISAATGISSGYNIVFTNEAGKTWSADPSSGSYSVSLPLGYTYTLSLSDANGYVISTSRTLDVNESSETLDVTIEKVTLYTLSGSVTGLSTADLAKLTLSFATSDETKVFEPSVVLNSSTGEYSVQIEPSVEYIASAEGVNDYEILSNAYTIAADETGNIVFTAKPTYAVSISTTDSSTGVALTTEQLSALGLTFTNMNEEGYVYSFSSVDNIELRDGTYSVACEGIDDYPLQLALTSNLKVEGSATTKDLVFDPITNWTFADKQFSAASYEGLIFSSSVTNEVAKGHVGVADGVSISVPIKSGQKVVITYYYSAGFTIDGGTTVYTTVNSAGTTNVKDEVEYVYTGSESTVDITVSGTATYFTNIEVKDIVPYASVIYVGTSKEYTTINEALDAIAHMDDRNDQRVTVMIDPGNYEEMLVIDQDNISLVNASTSPSIALADQGRGIDDNAVRITSYYGHGYNYYSMGDDQKWHGDILAVNKENGYVSYENLGAGTTNGSFWNATVVVKANGFEAENIIFENSFNQYISAKEASDVVEEWASGSKGDRSVLAAGSLAVQDKSYVERAAALAIASGDKTILNNCRIVGHQDSFYGARNSRVAIYKGVMMGGTDYLFGGMIAVFYQSDLALTTSDSSSDVAYITAAQQSSGRGYLMYQCNIVSAVPGLDISSDYDYSKPGYFGRPWEATTSEVVFYETNIDACQNSGYTATPTSLINEVGWLSSLGGESAYMYEFGTVESATGVDNSDVRASWSSVLTSATLSDDTAITPLNFTKGSDGWDPFPSLIADDPTGIDMPNESNVKIYSVKNEVVITNVTSKTLVSIYDLSGQVVKSAVIYDTERIALSQGCFIVKVEDAEGIKAVKVVTYL